MKWDEFRDLLKGISPDTALGRIVSIRSEERKEVLEHFTKDQHHIRNDWKARRAKELAKEMSEADMDTVMKSFKQAFLRMAGVEGGKTD